MLGLYELMSGGSVENGGEERRGVSEDILICAEAVISREGYLGDLFGRHNNYRTLSNVGFCIQRDFGLDTSSQGFLVVDELLKRGAIGLAKSNYGGLSWYREVREK